MTPASRLQRLTAAEFALLFQGRARQLAWFLGSGASASAGIPTGYDMITEFKARLFCAETGLAYREIDAADPIWLERIETHAGASTVFPPPGSPEEYSAYFEAVYPTQADRRNFIDDKLRRASPSFGHRVLAASVASGQSLLVYTTNFDQLIETACTTADEMLDPNTRVRLSVADLQRVDVAERCATQGDWPLLTKLHGDYQSEKLKNISTELATQDESLRAVLVSLCARFGLVVAGYSGRDDSVMEALGAGLSQSGPFQGGIFWVTRPDAPLLPAATRWLNAAAEAGVDVHLVESENFDELMGALERQLTFPEALSEHVSGARPAARVTAVEMPVASGQQYPILRTSALPLLEVPTIARRIGLAHPATTRELRQTLRDADRGRHVAIAAIAGGAAAFGRDEDLLAGLAPLGPSIDGEIALEPGDNSWAHGLLYDGLVHALARGHPARPNPGGHLVILHPPPRDRDDDRTRDAQREIAGLRAAYRSALSGNATELSRYFAEAVRVRLEFWLDRWWCVLDPFTWLANPTSQPRGDDGPPQTRRPTQAETDAAASWRRERWAQRYNAQWDALIQQWSAFFAPSKQTAISAFGLGVGEGFDGRFELYQTSGWCPPGALPGRNWRQP